MAVAFTISVALGSLVRVSASFTRPATAEEMLEGLDDWIPMDPSEVVFLTKSPGASPAITTYTYGVDDEVVRDELGAYHLDVDANASGKWSVRCESTGTGQAAAEGEFKVLASAFDE